MIEVRRYKKILISYLVNVGDRCCIVFPFILRQAAHYN